MPLLLLVPLGLASQMDVPGLSPLFAEFNASLEDANASIQQQIGLFDPNTAAAVQDANRALGQFGLNLGTAAGAVALIVAGAMAVGYVVDNCTPGAADEGEAASSLNVGTSSTGGDSSAPAVGSAAQAQT